MSDMTSEEADRVLKGFESVARRAVRLGKQGMPHAYPMETSGREWRPGRSLGRGGFLRRRSPRKYF